MSQSKREPWELFNLWMGYVDEARTIAERLETGIVAIPVDVLLWVEEEWKKDANKETTDCPLLNSGIVLEVYCGADDPD